MAFEKGARWLPEGGFRISDLLHAAPDTYRDEAAISAPVEAKAAVAQPVSVGVPFESDSEFYDLFIRRARQLASQGPLTISEVSTSLQLEKKQASVWLDRAAADGYLQKATRPVRYVLPEPAASQPKLFS